MKPKFVDANGLRFGYLDQGGGPLVLLVHGFPDTAFTWDRALPALAEAGYHAVAPFTRGYAPTEIPADGAYDTDTLGKDVIAMIVALGGNDAIVVGHDWGASAAYAAAAMAPERVRMLVTVGIPHPRAIKPTPWLLWKLRHFATLRTRGAAERIRRGDLALVDELWRRWSPSWKDIPPAETESVKAAFREPGCLEAALAYYRSVSPGLSGSLRLPISVPTVAFAGEHDAILGPRTYEKARGCFTGSYEVVQVPGGHFMHREHPEPFLRELVRVLREHDARPS
jgi:pimeloyl-ACP methyl ester carboxylesterase